MPEDVDFSRTALPPEAPFMVTWPSGRRETLAQAVAHAKRCVGAGWHGVVEGLMRDLPGLGWNGVLCDVKEKFGGLRFYIGGGSDHVHDRIAAAENESYHTCENCGSPGEARQGGWIKTLCDDCHEKRRKEWET